MKKIYCFFVVICFSISAFAQKGTINYLNDNPQYGNILLGDSITKYLTVCNLLEEKGNGCFKCEVSEPSKECYKVGGISPFVVFVDVQNYLIKNILVYFKLSQCVDVLRAVTETYGKSNLMDDNATSYWYGKNANITVGVQGSKASYIIFSSIKVKHP
ncbi:MAG: hypothetical protein RRY07_04360 [Bacteroidaceae bacterium]